MAWSTAKIAIVTGVSLLLVSTIAAVYIYENNLKVEAIPKGWSVIRGDVDQWTDGDGKIHGHTITGESLLASSKEYRDITFSALCSTTNREASLAMRMEDADNGYIVIFAPSTATNAFANGLISLVRRKYGQEEDIGVYRGQIFASLGPSAKITVSAKGPWLQVFLNNLSVIRVKDTAIASGFIGLRIYGWGDHPCDATFSDLSFH